VEQRIDAIISGMNKDANFECIHCKKQVSEISSLGTKYRNHCPYCLWSKHADLYAPGDRLARCNSAMRPIGLTFKQERLDKFGKFVQGEIMIIHSILIDGTIVINRIAGDDDPNVILKIFESSKYLRQKTKDRLLEMNIRPLDEKDRTEINRQLFGSSST
jgi:DNA-directed RNA polymerase subunit RPC12/RpoP